ncbi:MAG: GIY-YIG nuclease family protein [Minisyncoccia bacterium]
MPRHGGVKSITTMWHVYVLKSLKTNKYYIGCSNNLPRRLREHNSGKNISTKFGIPWALVYEELFEDQKQAFDREKKIKSYKGGNAFKKLLDL